jgi:hypothetical protein
LDHSPSNFQADLKVPFWETSVPEQPAFLLRPLSVGAGTYARIMDSRLQSVASSRRFTDKPKPATSLEEKLFEARAAAKVLTSQVAMHFSAEDRQKLFLKLDALLSTEEWDRNDEVLEPSSFRTLLRLLLFLRPKNRPGLGLSFDGSILSVWRNGEDRLTLECLANDRIRWVLSKGSGENRESAAGLTTIERLLSRLEPYDPMSWFSDGLRISSRL